MKVLKFRFWDKEYKCWRELPDLYGDYQAQAFRTYGDGFLLNHFLCGEAQEKLKRGDIVIQQFINILDIDGKEIYNGDIVTFFFDGSTAKGVIVFSTYYNGWAILFPDTPMGNKIPEVDIGWVFLRTCPLKVVGNIFENPLDSSNK